jgi:hypothetical protein
MRQAFFGAFGVVFGVLKSFTAYSDMLFAWNIIWLQSG